MPVDYSAEGIDARLKAASDASARIASSTPRVPMTAEGIDLRLRQASDLSAACLQLGRLVEPRER